MKTTTKLGLRLGLGLGFGILLLAIVYYYFLIRLKKHKKRITNQESEEEEEKQQQEEGYVKETSKSEDESEDIELGFETELIKRYNQRYLFTIMEETKTDMESDDGISRSRRRSLSDITNDIFTPGVTPKASSLETYSNHGFNPLFESNGELEFNKIFRSSSSSSPPPKFKFMRDAEEKFRRRLVEEAIRRDVTEGSFMKFLKPEKKQSIGESDETLSFSSCSTSGTNLRKLDQK